MRFKYFCIFAEMRTGSNFLETALNQLDGVQCLGEVFNPEFVGYPNRTELLGLSQTERDRDPRRLLSRLVDGEGAVSGFRFFHDHDHRVADLVLEDPACGKILLSRDPLESYASWKIARETGQWKLTNLKRRRTARIEFDTDEFLERYDEHGAFRARIWRRLKVTGQTAFLLSFEDLKSLDVLNGLAAWLGVSSRLGKLPGDLKRQNPESIFEKVSNPQDIERAIARIGLARLEQQADLEPPRRAPIRGCVGAARAPLLFLPIKGGPEPRVESWLASLDAVA